MAARTLYESEGWEPDGTAKAEDSFGPKVMNIYYERSLAR